MNFVQITAHLFVNLDSVTDIAIDSDNPRVVKISYTNHAYTAIPRESAEEADAMLKEIAGKLPTWKRIDCKGGASA